jgi:hypothetical protein
MAERLPFAQVTTTTIQDGPHAIVASGEVAPGRRTAAIWMRLQDAP